MSHRHKAISDTERAWSGCVNPRECPHEGSHGAITRREVCSCGAERSVEINGRWETASEWFEREERLPAGEGAHVQFRCDRAIREGMLSYAEATGCTERLAWEEAARTLLARAYRCSRCHEVAGPHGTCACRKSARG